MKEEVKACKHEVTVFFCIAAFTVVLWNGCFEECSAVYELSSLLLTLYLVIMEVPKQRILEKENQIYRELLLYLSRVKHRYVSCKHIANAIQDAAEDMSYEIQRLAGELYRVLMGSDRKEAVREYILYHDTNRYLKLFLIQAYEVSETGDVYLPEGSSLFAENVEHLRLELMEELYRRKRRTYKFAGYIFVAVAPVYMMPILKMWGLEFAPELEHFYKGYGQLLELVTLCTVILVYGLINRAKEIALFRGKGEGLWNIEGLYELPGVMELIHFMERAEGKISKKLRHLILLSGERLTYGKLCVQILAVIGCVWTILLSCVIGVHRSERQTVLAGVTAIDTIAPVASDEKKAMLSLHILEVTKQCIEGGEKNDENIRKLLQERIKLSNETLERAAIREIQNKLELYERGHVSVWEIFFCLLSGLLTGVLPIVKLMFLVKAAKAGAVYEIGQFQSVILMEHRLQGITIVGLLEDMEIFSQSFRNVLRKCINTYGAGPQAALVRMKEEGESLHESFAELADAFLSVDEVGVSKAFAEVEGNRKLLERMSRLEAEIDMERKKDNTDLISRIPMALSVGAYFIIPFFMYSLKGVYEVFELLEEMQI